MPRPLSVDLRTRIVNACAAQEWPQAEIAELFQVPLETVEKLWKQWRTTPSLALQPHAGAGRPVWLPRPQTCASSWPSKAAAPRKSGSRCCANSGTSPSVHRGCPAPSRRPVCREKKVAACQRAQPPGCGPGAGGLPRPDATTGDRGSVLVDESGVTTRRTRLYGRAPQGQRVPAAVPHGPGKGRTILGALSLAGRQAARTVEAATEAASFAAFLERVLAPTLRPGPVVLLDNLSAHQQEQARVLVEARGCRLRYWPPYSPDRNPIERAWPKVQSRLRARKGRAWEALEQGVQAALAAITAEDSRGYFAHCGYTLS